MHRSWSAMLRLVVMAGICVVASPTLAHAQSAIAGVIKDATGALLPGVTVEARSPSLIEKTRSVVTDAGELVGFRPANGRRAALKGCAASILQRASLRKST